MTKANRSVWQNFDWTKLTTLVMCGFYDPELMCFAHKNNVRVVSLGEPFDTSLKSEYLTTCTINSGIPPKEMLTNDQKVDKWIDDQLQYAKDRFMDGINIDIEYEIDRNTPFVDGLSKLMFKLRDKFHAALPKSQVTFDVPWSPYNAKGVLKNGQVTYFSPRLTFN